MNRRVGSPRGDAGNSWVTVEASTISLATVLPSGLVRRFMLTVVEVVTTGRSARGGQLFYPVPDGARGQVLGQEGRLGCQPAVGCSAWLAWLAWAVSSSRLPCLAFS